MTAKKELHTTQLYGRLMEEAKIRLASIETALNGRTGFIAPLVREFCYLQLRMLCELIALGCLVAHGDMTGVQTRKLRKAWSASGIVDELDNLHPNFYPMPFKEAPSDDGNKTYPLMDPPEYLTKDRLKALNGKCGDVLHRGDVDQVRLNGLRLQITLPDSEVTEIVGWCNQITALLGGHFIPLFDGQKLYLCMLRTNKSDRVFMAECNVDSPIWPTPAPHPAR